ncbi:carboxylesterase [Schizothecium vesticola]|uniref:Carboxylic ester hydrolase n=1 Tax=Schizothecium vesticola TaxID=314040 RepID=A0AA40F868_9PEZI|nr:carboxylesterase [Schizothecium vesticola]
MKLHQPFPFLLLLLLPTTASTPSPHLTVKTPTGTFTALLDPLFPHVRQFRSIPYALPPLGSRRWLPPTAFPPSTRHTYTRRFPPSCPQYQPANISLWTSNISDFAIRLYPSQSFNAGAVAQSSDEDCLHLAIFSPVRPDNGSTAADTRALPVALFLPGGDFTAGGIDVPYQLPTPWIERTQKHIVVTINYRVNIFGFPWAGGLDTDKQNLGLLDARMALEWTYANIALFGGDPARITLWGQSAGAVAADMLVHAWPSEPLVSGVFLQSGTAMVDVAKPDEGRYGNFSVVAKGVGCDFPPDGEGRAAELECMRGVPMGLIENFVGGYKDRAEKPALTFKPAMDGRVVFGDYKVRGAEEGGLARVPALVGTTSNEGASMVKYPAGNLTEGPWQKTIDGSTVGVFVCLASNTTAVRGKSGRTTYRYEYAGNFSSVTPFGWMGAYHASDVPMLFGTYGVKTPGRVNAAVEGISGFERRVAEAMQDHVLAFMEDPEDGLRNRGWPAHDDGGGRNMMRFAAGRNVERLVNAGEVDDACVLGKEHNPSPI